MAGEFIFKRTVQFAETDAAGVLHFSNYFRIMEEAEHAFWRSLGLSVMTADGDRVIGWPRVAAALDYSCPVRFEDELEIALRVERLTEKSLTLGATFRHEARTVAEGQMTAVCCATVRDSFESIPVPDEIRKKLDAYIAGG